MTSFDNNDIERLKGLIAEIDEIQKCNSSGAPNFKVWRSNVERVLVTIFGDSIQLKQFNNIKYYPAMLTVGNETRNEELKKQRLLNGLIEARHLLSAFLKEIKLEPSQGVEKTQSENKKDVFIVHGHDEVVLLKVKDFLQSLTLNPIILHDEADEGLTVIEKFEKHSSVSFAVILLTPDDEGYEHGKESQKRSRARQNVILEMGFFLGKLGRGNVRALYKEDVEIPSDYAGVLFVKFEGDDWKLKLAKEMKVAGLDLDLNRLVG